jgi:hypothetical protein
MAAYRSDHIVFAFSLLQFAAQFKGDKMKFSEGDEAVWLHEEQEIPVIVLACETTHEGVELYRIDVHGQEKHVRVSELLAPKKPGFEIRDLVFVLTENKDAVQGEVVTTGIGPKNRTFYQLRFEPEIGFAQSWYSEDEVFIVSNPKKRTVSRVGIL